MLLYWEFEYWIFDNLIDQVSQLVLLFLGQWIKRKKTLILYKLISLGIMTILFSDSKT